MVHIQWVIKQKFLIFIEEYEESIFGLSQC